MSESSPADVHVDLTQVPPTHFFGILRRIGPGLILAGSIVGSGELIATTKTGAEAGFALLWLIIIGCVIKVFAQIEIGRYTIVQGKTAMAGLNEVPGPRLRVNWILWYWVLMFVVSLGQLGGIVGGVGQVMAMSMPLTEAGKLQNKFASAQGDLAALRVTLKLKNDEPKQQQLLAEEQRLTQQLAQIRSDYQRLYPESTGDPKSQDDLTWAIIVAVITSILLVVGRYSLVQNVSTVTVASFTVMTVFAVVALQTQPEWAIRPDDILTGIGLKQPDKVFGWGTALATFGIIGVGANELISYPYWCLEKGYARFTGPRDDSVAWGERAKGWMRVMHFDAWGSMIVYTFATVAFYLLGAAVLYRSGQNPSGNDLIRTLSEMYVRPFGAWTQWLFVVGAFGVLYSTFFVATASQARVASDVMRVFGFVEGEKAWRNWIRLLCGLFPFLCVAIYWLIPEPGNLVLAGGAAQFVMLPFLAIAALYFRYRRGDSRLVPGIVWDMFLWISSIALIVGGAYGTASQFWKMIEKYWNPK